MLQGGTKPNWVIVAGKSLIEAAAALVRFAKATSDPQLAAALISKAADINDRLENAPASASDADLHAPDVQPINQTSD